MVSIIIADDDNDFLISLSELLESKKIKVLGTATNGKDAIDEYIIHKPDFAIMDYHMPKYDGLFALMEIRKLYPQSKIIILTAGKDQYLVDESTRLGVHAIFSKPVEIEHILKKIKKSINCDQV